jgi:hypothetical protein
MTTPGNPADPFSPFLPTTFNPPEEDDRHDIFLQDTFSNFADVINDKSIGTMVVGRENFDGEKWWYKNTKITRNGYQTFCYIPSLPNIGTVVFTLNNPDPNLAYPIDRVNPEFVITMVYGTASRPCSAIFAGDGDYIMYTNRGDPRIFFDMSDTIITITTTIDMSEYSGFLVIKYLRNGT